MNQYTELQEKLKTYTSAQDITIIKPIIEFCEINILVSECQLKIASCSQAEKPALESELRKLEWKLKKSKNQLLQIFTTHIQPTLKTTYRGVSVEDSSKINHIALERNSLINKIAGEFCSRICEFKRPTDTNNPFLRDLQNWVRYRLRYNYELFDLLGYGKLPARATKFNKLKQFINENEGKINVTDFAKIAGGKKEGKKGGEKGGNEAEIIKYLEELIKQKDPKSGIEKIDDLNYYCNPQYKVIDLKAELEETTVKSINSSTSLNVSSISNDPEGKTLLDMIDDKSSLEDMLDTIRAGIPNNFKHKVQLYLQENVEQNLSSVYCRNRLDCNCYFIFQHHLSPESENVSLLQLATQLGISRQTLYSHWNDKCMPLIYEAYIKLANAENMRKYIEKDPKGKLEGCKFAVKPDVINCQTLVNRLGIHCKNPPDTYEAIAKDYSSITITKIKEFWQEKCLPLLAEIACEVTD